MYRITEQDLTKSAKRIEELSSQIEQERKYIESIKEAEEYELAELYASGRGVPNLQGARQAIAELNYALDTLRELPDIVEEALGSIQSAIES